MYFGKTLRALRTARGFSQQQLADKANLSVNAVSAFERGIRFPRAKTIDLLASVLRVQAGKTLEGVLESREPGAAPYSANRSRGAFAELVELLRSQPEKRVRLILDLTRRILQEISHQDRR